MANPNDPNLNLDPPQDLGGDGVQAGAAAGAAAAAAAGGAGAAAAQQPPVAPGVAAALAGAVGGPNGNPPQVGGAAAQVAPGGAAALPPVNPVVPVSVPVGQTVRILPAGTAFNPIPGRDSSVIPGPPNLYMDRSTSSLTYVGQPPTNSMVRYISENEYLKNVAAQAADPADRTAASAILARRFSDVGELAIAVQSMGLEVAGQAQANVYESSAVFNDNIPVPPLHTRDIVPSTCRKEFNQDVQKEKFSAESTTFDSHVALQAFLTTASTFIELYKLSGVGAFALLRPHLKGLALEMHAIYARPGGRGFSRFWNLLQSRSKSKLDKNEARRQKMLIMTAPQESLQISATLTKILKINKYLVDTNEPDTYVSRLEQLTCDDYRSFADRHYPSLAPTLFAVVNSKKLKAEAEVASLRAMGRFEEASNAEHHELTALTDAMTSILQVQSETNRLSYEPLPNIAGGNSAGGSRNHRRQVDAVASGRQQGRGAQGSRRRQPQQQQPQCWQQQQQGHQGQYQNQPYVAAASQANQPAQNWNNLGARPRDNRPRNNQGDQRPPHFSNSHQNPPGYQAQGGPGGPPQPRCFRCGRGHLSNQCQRYPDYARYHCTLCNRGLYHLQEKCQEVGGLGHQGGARRRDGRRRDHSRRGGSGRNFAGVSAVQWQNQGWPSQGNGQQGAYNQQGANGQQGSQSQHQGHQNNDPQSHQGGPCQQGPPHHGGQRGHPQ